MQIALTGGTGFIGAQLLRQLVAAGHQVTALVRSDAAAEAVSAAGAVPAVGDLTDTDWTAVQFASADAAAHTASPGDASSAGFDRAVAEAAARAFAGTGKAYVHTGGVWVWGDSTDIQETDEQAPPALTAWRAEVEEFVLGIDGARAVLIAPGIVYGYGSGIPAILAGGEPTAEGALR